MNGTSDATTRDGSRDQHHLPKGVHENGGHTSDPILDEAVPFYQWPLAGNESDSIQGVTV